MTNGVKTVIAIGAVLVTTQLIGFVIGKKLMKISKDTLEAFGGFGSSDEESETSESSFVDVEVKEDC